MGVEERLALRLAIRVGALLLLVVTTAAGQSYGYGTRPLWFAVAVGIPVVLLIYAGLVSRRWGAKPPGALVWGTAKRGGRRVKRLVEGVVAAVHGARRRGRVRRVELAAQEEARPGRGRAQQPRQASGGGRRRPGRLRRFHDRHTRSRASRGGADRGDAAHVHRGPAPAPDRRRHLAGVPVLDARPPRRTVDGAHHRGSTGGQAPPRRLDRSASRGRSSSSGSERAIAVRVRLPAERALGMDSGTTRDMSAPFGVALRPRRLAELRPERAARRGVRRDSTAH